MDNKKFIEDTPLAHVYAQDYWHTPAFIVFNKKMLPKLKQAIEEIESGKSISVINSCAQDGEWYNLVLAIDDFSSPLFCQYIEEICGRSISTGKHPESRKDYNEFIKK